MMYHSASHLASDGRGRRSDGSNSAGYSVLRAAIKGPAGYSYAGLSPLLILYMIFVLLTNVLSIEAVERTVAPIQQQTQEPGTTVGAIDGEKDIRALEFGKPIKRELTGGQHTYQIGLNAGQFLKVIVEQNGIDVVVQVAEPDGKQILEFDSESRLRGWEEASLVADAAGVYRLTVRVKLQRAAAGSYEIRIEELRTATETDRALHQAHKQYGESLKMRVAGKYDEAIPLIERAIETRERLLRPDHRDVAAAVHVQAVLYWYKGNYAKAELLHQRALTIREKALGPEHPDIAASLNGLAIVYDYKGEYAKEEPLYKRALTIYEKALGADHPLLAITLNNLAILYQMTGEYAKAEDLHQHALNIREKVFGAEHADVADSLYNLAFLYWIVGNYPKAEPLYRRALAMREKVLGTEHPYVAESLNNLGFLYGGRGDYEKAESLFLQALMIREKALGPEHSKVADTLYNLANIYTYRGEYGKAEELFQRTLTIREKALGMEHPRIAASLDGLATIYRHRGENAKAESLFRRALEMREKTLGKDHPNVAESLNNLADLYRAKGDFATAGLLYQRALVILEKTLGPEHPNVMSTLSNLSVLYTAKGDLAEAVKFQSRASAVSERNLALNLVIGSERQRLAYLATLPNQTDQTISLHLLSDPNDPIMPKLATTVILQRKARALDATSETLNALRSRFNAEDRALLDQWIQTRSQLARFVLNGPQRMTADQYRSRIRELEAQAEQYEADISQRNDEFRAQSVAVTLEAVQAAIPANAALIEFVSYRHFNAKTTKDDEAYSQPHYIAYILSHNGQIQWKELGEAKPIDQAIAALRKALRNPNRSDVKQLARSVDKKIFQPVRSLLGESRQLLISPDGPLNLIPFAALVDEQGRYLVERYSISYLTSGRDLLHLQVARESKNPPLVFANPDFGEPKVVKAARPTIPNNATREGQPKGKPVAESARSAFNKFSFLPLPYTAGEGEALRALLPDATLLMKRQATKAALLQIRSPLILHIATHGFFLEDLKLPLPNGRGYQAFDNDPERLLKQIERDVIHVESPLLRSGLALAGANEHKEEDNGILTAMEVTGLNLWGTKLVVLSACDTGVGEVRNGDGVHGLRRALVLAGSETQVTSLWAIQDKTTRDMMVTYYRRLKQGEGRGEALRQVQLEMLKQVRRRHPYYWASFIQSGEWANLGG